MINKKLTEITEEDLNNLIENQVIESRTIEYKEELSKNQDSDKKEFLADVSSFANTSGGDILYGIKENEGLPSELVGIETTNPDGEILRMEQIINTGIQPKIRAHINSIKLENDNYIFIIRIDESIISPHRVIFKGHDKFYARGSNSKYSLDVEQLRSSFLLSSSIEEKIKDFHISRVMDIESEKTPIPLLGKNKIIIHTIPLESFSTKNKLSIEQLKELKHQPDEFRPMYTSSSWFSPQINLDGLLTHGGRERETARTYSQLYRKGIIESVESFLLDRDESATIPSYTLEDEIIKHINKNLKLLNSLEINTPIYVMITLTGIKGLKLSSSSSEFSHHEDTVIKQNIINLPEVLFENYEQDVPKSLKQSFDLVWNACGISSSKNFDTDGNWIQR